MISGFSSFSLVRVKALRHSSMKPTLRYAHLELAHLRGTHDEVSRIPVNFAVVKPTSEDDLLQAKTQWQEALKRRKKQSLMLNPHFIRTLTLRL